MKGASSILARRVHDYSLLVRRWRSIAKSNNLIMRPYQKSAGYSLYYLRSKDQRLSRTKIYISAGIHGDEPASTEGLIQWAESHAQAFHLYDFLIFPCLNPWGIVNNVRVDAEHRDLNRFYQSREIPQIAAQLDILKGKRFDGALTLHEDYDAEGLYLYEIWGPTPLWGEAIRDAASKHVSVDSRSTIDGRKSEKGIVRRRMNRLTMPLMPEALYLYLEHSERVITFETPSEVAIKDRVAAQSSAIQAFINLAQKEYLLKADKKLSQG